MRRALWLGVALFAAHAPAAHAHLADAINRARAVYCGARSGPLVEDRRLREVAARVAAGAPLRSAMRAAGYVAAQSTLLHVRGDDGDPGTARDLAGGACRALADPAYRRIGAVRRGDQAWIVLASAIALPAAAAQTRFDREALALVNRARASGARCGRRRFGAAPPLRADPRLAAAALAHSRDMARHRRFAHRGDDGSTPAQRAQRAGYRAYAAIGENIAAGTMTPAEAVRGWLASPGHCENIMDRRFRDTGIAFALDPAGPYGIYWTEDFGAPAAR